MSDTKSSVYLKDVLSQVFYVQVDAKTNKLRQVTVPVNFRIGINPCDAALTVTGPIFSKCPGSTSVFEGDLIVCGSISATEVDAPNLTGSAGASVLQWTVGPNTLSTTSSVNINGGNGLYAEGAIIADGGLSGSLTRLHTGLSYLVQGAGILVTSASNGSVTIASTAGTTPLQWTVGSDNLNTTSSVNIHDSLYVLGPITSSLGLSGSLTRLHNGLSYIAAGLNISVISESNGSINIHGIPRQWTVGDGTLTTTASVETTGYLYAQSSITSDAGLSGSLTRLHTGLSYLVQGENITITSESNGSVTIANSFVPTPQILQWTVGADNLSTTSSVNIHDTLRITGPLTSSLGYSGSLTKLIDGTSYLIQGTGISITSASNGAITITNTAPDSALQWTVGADNLSTTSSVNINGGNGLYAEGVITADGGLSGSLTKLATGASYLVQGIGISITSESNGSVIITNTLPESSPAQILQWTVAADNLSTTSSVNIHDTLRVTGPVTSSLGYSGSLTKLTDGSSYLIQGIGISITSASNGAVTITNTAPDTGLQALQWTVGADNLSTTSSVNIHDTLRVTGPVTSSLGYSGSLTKLIDGRSYIAAGLNINVISASNDGITIHGIPRQWTVGDDTLTTTSSIETTGYIYAASSITTDQGFSGSLTKLHTGDSYLVQGVGISITSASNGSVTIVNTAPGAAATPQWTDNGNTLSTTASVSITNNNLAVTGTLYAQHLAAVNNSRVLNMFSSSLQFHSTASMPGSAIIASQGRLWLSNSNPTSLMFSNDSSAASASHFIISAMPPIIMSPDDAFLRSSSFVPASGTYVAGGNKPCIRFSASATNTVMWHRMMPYAYNRGNLNCRILWSGDTANSGSVVWLAAVERFEVSNSVGSANSTTSFQTTIPYNGTANILQATNFVISNVDFDSVAPGDAFRFLLQRLGTNASDHYSGSVNLFTVQILQAG